MKLEKLQGVTARQLQIKKKFWLGSGRKNCSEGYKEAIVQFKRISAFSGVTDKINCLILTRHYIHDDILNFWKAKKKKMGGRIENHPDLTLWVFFYYDFMGSSKNQQTTIFVMKLHFQSIIFPLRGFHEKKTHIIKWIEWKKIWLKKNFQYKNWEVFFCVESPHSINSTTKNIIFVLKLHLQSIIFPFNPFNITFFVETAFLIIFPIPSIQQ